MRPPPEAAGPGSPGAQHRSLLPWGGAPAKAAWQQLPALHVALRVALGAPAALEAAAATAVIGAFCASNAQGQAALAATFEPPASSGHGGGSGFGFELCSALVGSGGGGGGGSGALSKVSPLAASQRAALVLCPILSGSGDAKERLAAALGGGDGGSALGL